MNEKKDLLYLVTIEFNKNVSKEKVDELCSHFNENEVISRKGYVFKALWSVDYDEGSHEIDNSLFYFLNAGEYGVHYSDYISSKEEAIAQVLENE